MQQGRLPEFIASTLPPPQQWRGRSIWRSDLGYAQSSDGLQWLPVGALSAAQVAAFDDGVFQDSQGREFIYILGDGYAPLVGAVYTQTITLDEGSDANHSEILLTANCGLGDVPDSAIASARFSSPDGYTDVIKTLLTGAVADGRVQDFTAPSGLRNLFLARRTTGPFTVAAGATITAAQMVQCSWPSAAGIIRLEIRFGEPYVGAGTNKRYRQMIVTGRKAA